MPRVAIRKAGHRQCGGMHGSKIKYSRATIAIQEGVDHMVAGVGISDRLESDQPYIWYGTCQRATARSCLSLVRRFSGGQQTARFLAGPYGGDLAVGTAPVPGRPVSLSRFADGLSFRPKSSSVSIVGFAGAVRERTPPPLGRGPRRTELETRHARFSGTGASDVFYTKQCTRGTGRARPRSG